MISLLEFEYLILLAIYGGFLVLEHYPNQKYNSDLENKIVKVLNVAIFIIFPLALMFIGFIMV